MYLVVANVFRREAHSFLRSYLTVQTSIALSLKLHHNCSFPLATRTGRLANSAAHKSHKVLLNGARHSYFTLPMTKSVETETIQSTAGSHFLEPTTTAQLDMSGHLSAPTPYKRSVSETLVPTIRVSSSGASAAKKRYYASELGIQRALSSTYLPSPTISNDTPKDERRAKETDEGGDEHCSRRSR